MSKILTVAAALASAAALPAQLAARPPDDGARADDPRIAFHSAGDEVDGARYGLWALGRDYKVSLHDGMQFVPYLGDREAVTVRWTTVAVTFGGVPLRLEPGASFEHGAFHGERRLADGVIERYDVLADGVEQSFRIARRAGAGDLVIVGHLATRLRIDERDGHGPLELRARDGAPLCHYGAAWAIDAAGDSIPIATRHRGDGVIRLTVPAWWVARAAFPVIVDPLLQPVTVSTGAAVEQVEIARDDAANQVLVARSRQVSATDHDIFVELRTDDLQTRLGTIFTDATASWSSRRPAAAFVGAPRQWVIAFDRTLSSGRKLVRLHRHASGDTATNTGVVYVPVPGDRSWSNADVGGTLLGRPGDRALVVFEDDPADGHVPHTEVRGLLYDARSGTLGTDFVVSALGGGTIRDREMPRVNQVGGGDGEGWFVVFQQFIRTAPSDEWGVLGYRIDREGHRDPSGHYIAPLAAAPYHVTAPVVAGLDGRYLVGFGVTPLAVEPGPTPNREAVELHTDRIDWPVGGGWTRVATGPIDRAPGRSLRFGDLAFDNRFGSHWLATVREKVTGRAEAVLLGGLGGEVQRGVVDDGGTGAVADARLCFDDDARRFQIAWGSARTGNPVLARLFAFDALAPTVAYGTSCGGVVAPVGENRTGNDRFAVELRGAAPNAPGGLLVGLAAAAVPLDPLGLAGCTLHLDPGHLVASVPLTASAIGRARVEFPLVDRPLPLVGDLFFQAAWIDPARNALGVAVTSGLQVRVHP